MSPASDPLAPLRLLVSLEGEILTGSIAAAGTCLLYRPVNLARHSGCAAESSVRAGPAGKGNHSFCHVPHVVGLCPQDKACQMAT